MGDGEKKKVFGPEGARAFWAGMSEAERSAFIKARSEKIQEAKKAKAEAEAKQAEERNKVAIGLPAVEAIGAELTKMQDRQYVPSWAALQIAIQLAREGKDLEAIRGVCFPDCPQETWVRFKKMMFANQVSSPEDVGNELLIMRDMITADIRRQIRKMEEQQSNRPLLYHQQIVKALASIQQLHSDVAKRLVDIGAVGSKRTGGIAIQIINNIPRPERPLAHTKKAQPQYVVAAPKEITDKGAEDIEVMTVQAKVVE